MSQNAKRQTKKAPNKNLKLFGALLGIIVVAVATAMLIFNPFKSAPKSNTTASTSQVTKSSTKNTYQPSKEEKEYLAKRFADLKAINSDSTNRDILICIGPEGGFQEKEINDIIECGGQSVTLGHTILRAETAAIAALSMVHYELEL